jgi:hypothetical protein
LFKIRHALSLEGVEQRLPLFEPPIDPALLVRAAAAGIDINSLLSDLSAPLPYQRYAVLAQRAADLVNELKGFGGALLSALEKRDAEELASLRAEHEINLLKLVRDSKKAAIEEAVSAKTALINSQAAAQARYEYYDSLVFTNEWEKQQDARMRDAERQRYEASALNGMAAAAGATVNAQVGTSGPGAFITTMFGGGQLAAILGAQSAEASTRATISDMKAQALGLQASYQRRFDEWQMQKAIAKADIDSLGNQITAAQFKIDLLTADLATHDVQRENAIAVRDFMWEKYTSEQLYNWMLGELSGVYFQTYKLAYDMAKRAERAWQFELADTDRSFVSFGYWIDLRKGLLAGEKLGLDLKRMDAAYLDRNKREYELTRHIPLSMLDPLALQVLRTRGTCQLNVPEAFFDMDSPGHYLRRIKHVSVTITGTAGPYTPVRCKLTLNSSSVRMKASIDTSAVKASNVAVQSIVTSSGHDDGGLFETNLRDERYLPFEGAGAVSAWTLELPTTIPLFDWATISEVVLHMRYTARDGGAAFRDQVIGTGRSPQQPALKSALNTMPLSSSRTGLQVGISLKSAFADAWQRFIQSTGTTASLPFVLDTAHLPHPVPAGATVKQVDFVLVLSEGQPWSDVTLTITPDGSTRTLQRSATVGNHPMASIAYSTPSLPPLGSWTLACPSSDLGKFAAAQDLYVVVSYQYPETL